MIDIRYFLARQKAGREGVVGSPRRGKKAPASVPAEQVTARQAMRITKPAARERGAMRGSGVRTRKVKSS